MSAIKPEDWAERRLELAGWSVRVVSYRLGDTYLCTVDNVDPGARVARGRGSTREEAEGVAIDRAETRLAATRRRSAS
ncbi:MAG: hypothetical protein ABFS34_04695 [Gemmatimonadota bacterium]